MSTPKCLRKRCDSKGIRPGQLCTKHYRIHPHGLINATPARERVAALRAAGYSMAALSKLTGLSTVTLRNVGKWTDAGTVTLDTHQRIMAIKVPTGFVSDTGLVDAVGTRRRIQALQAAGWRQQDLAHEMGFNQQIVSDLMYRERVLSRTAAVVADVFSRLQMKPGPSDLMRRRAKAWGWALPFDWDEDTIDNPDARPHRRLSKTPSFTERYTDMRECGMNRDQIAEALGINRKSLERQLSRYQLWGEKTA